MLKINNLSKSFGRIDALSNVNLNITRGEFYGLLKPDGAGKSIFISIIVGYLQADIFFPIGCKLYQKQL